MIDIENSLAELHSALDLQKLSPTWAKIELFLGLTAAATGLLLALQASVEIDWARIILSMALMVFGAYLAMAGHRSHLYQSNNKLAAYLAESISKRPQ